MLMFNSEGDNIAFAIYSIENQAILYRFLIPIIGPLSSGEFFTRPQSTYGDKCLSTQGKRFIADGALDILAVELYLELIPSTSRFFVISVTKLLKVMERLRELRPDALVFEWEEWGPDVTRFLPPRRMSPPSSRPTFGSRLAVFYTNEDEEPIATNRKIAILDFNPRPILKGKVDGTGMGGNVLIVDTESECENPHNDQMIKSRLPYRMFRKDWRADGDDCHLEANTMILRRVCLGHLCH
jgi:hypothetical protein